MKKDLVNKLKLIPAVGAVGAVLPACADPLVGDWSIVKVYGKVLPKSYTEDGTTYTKSAMFSFEADGDAETIWTKSWTGAKTGTKSYVTDGVWEKVSRGSYVITFDEHALNCSIDGRELECDGDMGAVEAEKL